MLKAKTNDIVDTEVQLEIIKTTTTAIEAVIITAVMATAAAVTIKVKIVQTVKKDDKFFNKILCSYLIII